MPQLSQEVLVAVCTSGPLFGFLIYLLKHGEKHTTTVIQASKEVLDMQHTVIATQSEDIGKLKQEIQNFRRIIDRQEDSIKDIPKIRLELEIVETKLELTERQRDNLQIENKQLHEEIAVLRAEVQRLRSVVDEGAQQ